MMLQKSPAILSFPTVPLGAWHIPPTIRTATSQSQRNKGSLVQAKAKEDSILAQHLRLLLTQ